MKRNLVLGLAMLFGIAAFAGGQDTASIIPSIEKQRLALEAKRAPKLAQMWREHDLSAADVYAVTGLVYTGSAQSINPTVKIGATTLTKNTHYTLTVTNNVNAGYATGTFQAMAYPYTGKQVCKFYIAPADLSGCTISNIASQVATGSPVCPLPVVKFGATTLTKDTDYEVSYLRNVGTGTNALVICTGIGNFKGQLSKAFTIADAE